MDDLIVYREWPTGVVADALREFQKQWKKFKEEPQMEIGRAHV